ncbi:site-specific DNA-methyltransferase [Candidatus Thiosymbion oneisti]|uniref:site-specific DNA-methyltransferase n=1 Tax=Candidatus Thiosymbion oneisti TaxID=589554 RepID=UPI001C405107|nr:DNA methyltransferase [Candidatus Thiosymbion oneisti]
MELRRITKEKKFGLVFEDHLPELTPIYSAKIRRHSKVALRDGPLIDLWRVLFVRDGEAHCRNMGSGETRRIPVDDLVVARRFGEPIFPALTPVDKVRNGPEDVPWHTLIEADNYHALQLLEYLYAGQVDCIYIDPPYNTGARDWKYNNDYVDANDNWRHSKWLTFMRRRLTLAKRLLNPKTGVLIVTIDEHEVHHLGMLLEQVFSECNRQMATIVINQKGVAQGRLSRSEEYAFFTFIPEAYLPAAPDDLLSPEREGARFTKPRWERLLRGGTNSRRQDRHLLFFPIFIDPEKRRITDVGDPLPLDETPDLEGLDKTVAWPLRKDGSLGNWRVSPPTLRTLVEQGFVKLGGYDERRKTWTILYLGKKARRQIDEGVIQVIARDPESGAVDVEYTESQQRNVKTVWHRPLHDSGNYGSSLLRNILGSEASFSFPKSLYAVKDSLATVLRDRENGVVVDFFAGSGTTLHAVNLLNALDGGQRRCILITNNEVSDEEARSLKHQGHQPGESNWEQHGICQSVTWPRSKYTILGKRDDGSELDGEYLTSKTVEREKPRKFQQIGFTSIEDLNTAAKKKQLVALIDGIPQSEVKKDSAFVVSEKHPASILFDESQADAWLEALEDQEHITDLYMVTAGKATFDDLKVRIHDLLGPVIVTEEEKRPMREGFAANLEYFRLDFLDQDHVALGRQFREILPLLWLRAGAIGPRPELPANQPLPAMLIPERNPFAVLVDETRFADFAAELEGREDLTHVFLVTDSEEAFQEMAGQLQVPNLIQLYRDYLENFVINKGGDGT